MKLMLLSWTAIRRGALLSLALSLLTPAFGQIIYPPIYPPTIAAPFVRITSPANHATFFTPVDIPIFAFAREGTYDYTNVEFFASTSNHVYDLGSGVSLSLSNVPPKVFIPTYVIRAEPRLGAVYTVVWTNVSAGTYALTAIARAGGFVPPEEYPNGLTRTSPPVNITVIAAVTNQNPADVVTVVATDPIAISSTNAYWVWEGLTNSTPSWTNWPPKHWQLFTNYGPKNAVFTVRRFGNAISNLTVNYRVGGTASNGVDYLDLPGTVTIPAGEGYGLVPVIPIDNGKSNFLASVVLTLTASTNSASPYTVGYPFCAEALVMDYWPHTIYPVLPPVYPPIFLPDQSFHVSIAGPDGAWVGLQTSPNMINWTTVSTNQVFQGSIDYFDPNAAGNPSGYYRTIPLTNAPAY